ncbi:saccharopine dehydrogenase NADP-binding domain-containing protein [Amycolatopsis minnesotensis]|uniref:Saccharopine dehydrogenase NADP binding domain-containing protein n=1 Tax=Amycolatopsis minnesotensis TaxID=337894 RepID=A0ABP5C0A9_9PSEU
MIGVVGGYGAVGAAAVRALGGWDLGPIRVGGRALERAARFVAEAASGGEAVAVDVRDPLSLAHFCDGCAVVLNCAGPAFEVGTSVAEAALASGCDYVDAAGDDELFTSVSGLIPPGRTAALSAGMLPGVSALLPRYALALLPDARRVTVYAGGRDRFTAVAAADFLTGGADAFGEPLAAWDGGRKVSGALATRPAALLPFFPERVTARPYLGNELARIAAAAGLDRLESYSVFAGDRALAALGGDSDPETAAERLAAASELDLFGRQPYALLVTEATSAGDGVTVALRGTGASALTGAFAALTVRQVLRGAVPAGTHHAGELLDPVTAAEALGALDGVELQVVPKSLESADFEEEVW